jgi:hypothetical protein
MAIRTRTAGFRIGGTKAFGLWRSMIVSGFFICPEWLIELRVRFHKEGSTKMSEINMTAPPSQLCVGIDAGKQWLDVALGDGHNLKRWPNTTDGHLALIGELKTLGVARVGIEATGGYEAEVLQSLAICGLCSSSLPAAAGARLCNVQIAACQERSSRCSHHCPMYGGTEGTTRSSRSAIK